MARWYKLSEPYYYSVPYEPFFDGPCVPDSVVRHLIAQREATPKETSSTSLLEGMRRIVSGITKDMCEGDLESSILSFRTPRLLFDYFEPVMLARIRMVACLEKQYKTPGIPLDPSLEETMKLLWT
ncbi:hypothetical protein OPT61_g4733 [Boeremia exigua]|uniref:Uncharacterized protein n=1 Tax=Boeremia exigua TaxID=749465 RepID=A0ACC2ICV4_9PLEO|nr:hypothetical protein OPT61_g4733 [Boeremia exigua]